MFRLTVLLCVSAELELADVVTTVVNQVIWLYEFIDMYYELDANEI
jgi:hypothetical protein